MRNDNTKRATLCSLPLALFLAVSAPVLLSVPTYAEVTEPTDQQLNTLELDIPQGSLTSALNQLARQAGVILSFDASILAGETTSGLKGSYSVDQAFDELLGNRGYLIQKTAQGYVITKGAVAGQPAAAISPNGQPVKLEALVVTASGFEQDIADAPASISVITREDLDNRYYSDVTDALRDVPGVVVTGGGGGDRGADISMRGMPASYTLILVDGKRQSSRESRPNGNAGFEQDWLPPLESIERIEVVRGPMSTLYGSDAMGGVINIITRKVPEQWHGDFSIDTVLQDSNRSGDIQEGNFYLGGPVVSDLMGLQIYGRVYEREEDEILNGYDEKSLTSLSAKLAITPSENHEFIVESGMSDQRRQAHMGMSAASTGCRGGCSDSDSEHKRRYYSLSHTGRWGTVGTTDSYIQQENTHNEGRDIEITNTIAQTSLVTGFESHILTVGANYEKQELNDQNSNQISDRTQIENTQIAVFAEDEWMVLDPLSITLGARLDKDENYGTQVSPRIYGVWHVTDQFVVKGGVSTGFRSPTLREVTSDWGQTSRGGNVYGNPDLEPETSINQELGVHYTAAGGFSTGLTVFNNDFENKITRVACPISICNAGPNQFGSDPTYRINVDEAYTRGVEWSLDYPVSDTWSTTASYTFTESEQESGEYKGSPLTQLPKHQVAAGLNWQPIEQWTNWMRLTYRGEESQPTTGPSTNSLIAPSYTFVDLGLTYRLAQHLAVKVAVYNVMDEEVNYDEYGYVDDGRRYWVGLNFGF